MLAKLDTHMWKNEIHPYLTQNTEVNSKWTEDLNVRPETVKLFEENTRGKLHNTGVGSGFMDMTSNA